MEICEGNIHTLHTLVTSRAIVTAHTLIIFTNAQRVWLDLEKGSKVFI